MSHRKKDFFTQTITKKLNVRKERTQTKFDRHVFLHTIRNL